MAKDEVAKDQAPMQAQEPIRTPHTVGPDFPGVTGTPAEGTRDMDRVRAEEDDDAEDAGDGDND